MLDVQIDAQRLMQRLAGMEKDQLPFAAALAATRTAKIVQAELAKEMSKRFDRPTPWTLKSLYVKPATKSNPVAWVKLKDRMEAPKGNAAADYLMPLIEGRTRPQKRWERMLERVGVLAPGWFAIPSRFVRLDQYGNVPSAIIRSILSQLQAYNDVGSKQNERDDVKTKRNRTRMYGRYFVSWATRDKTRHLQDGIYERVGGGMAIRPVFIFTDKPPAYAKRFPFYELGNALAQKHLPEQLDEAVEYAMRTAK